MKIVFSALWFAILSISTSAQSVFTINTILPSGDEYFSDVKYADDHYYALSIYSELDNPEHHSGVLFVFNNYGELTNQTSLGDAGTQYFRIVSIYHNKLKLIGSVTSDSCSSSLVFSEFDIATNSLTQISQYGLCGGNYIHSVRIVPGLDNKLFFEVEYSIEAIDQNEIIHQNSILTLDTAEQLSLVLNLGYWIRHLSVDFSGKGYVVKDANVCEYYDRNFNHRYQYNNGGNGVSPDNNSSHQPLVNHYLLEQVVSEDENHHQYENIRLIDSNLYTKKLAVNIPVAVYDRVTLPVYGGAAIASYNTIWTTANFGFIDQETPGYFSITRLDSDMKIVCTHFIGFDGQYKIFGITGFEDNGAIIYGWKKYYDVEHGISDKNAFALKIGNDCELSTTSASGPQNPIILISVYPDPTINDLTFLVNGFDPSILRVELVDVSGKILFIKKDLTNSIQVPSLPAGQYYYRILQENRLLGVGSWIKQ